MIDSNDLLDDLLSTITIPEGWCLDKQPKPISAFKDFDRFFAIVSSNKIPQYFAIKVYKNWLTLKAPRSMNQIPIDDQLRSMFKRIVEHNILRLQVESDTSEKMQSIAIDRAITKANRRKHS